MGFDEQAKEWDNEKNIIRSKAIGDEIKRLLKDKKALRAMDFGCGTGLVSFYLKDFFSDILLVDLSDGMIAEAAKKIKENKTENLHTWKGNILNYDENKKFDVIYAPLVLHHIDNYREIVVKLKSLLEDGGSLIIMDMIKDSGEFHKGSTETAHHGLDPKVIKIMLEDIFDCVTDTVEFFEGTREKEGNTVHFKLFSILGATK